MCARKSQARTFTIGMIPIIRMPSAKPDPSRNTVRDKLSQDELRYCNEALAIIYLVSDETQNIWGKLLKCLSIS